MWSTWKRGKGARRAATALTVSAVIGLNVTVAFLVHSSFPALRFTPQGDEPRPVAKTRTASVAEVARRTGKTPAEVVISGVLATPPVLPGGAQPVTSLQGVPSSPVDLACGTGRGPGPVTAAGRGWAVANGSQVTNLQAGYTVTVSAYAAGQGAVAFNALAGQVNEHCANKSGTARMVTSTGAGVEAATAWVTRSGGSTTAFFWRRGDVVAMVAATGASAPMAMVKEYDARIAAALAGVCVTINSTASDGARSPYVNRAGFTGLTTSVPVAMPAGVTAPTRLKTPAAVYVPAVSRPNAPSFPFWPRQLPSPVSAPVAPTVPTYPAWTTTVPVRVPDSQGPGCGWSFTGQPVPSFDAAGAASKAAVDAKAAADALRRNVASFSARVPAYRAAYTRYLADVRDFQSYAQAVNTVAAAWEVIKVDQARYRDAMGLYTAALAARDAFLARQLAAKTAYAAAVTACTTGIPIPTVPAPVPTTTVPAPTAPAVVCPPVPAPIITQPAPTAPQSPTPPADPRPAP